MTINPAIDNAIAAGVDIEPQWGEDVADTLNAAPRLIASATLAPAASSISIAVPSGYQRYRLTVRPVLTTFGATDYLQMRWNGLTTGYRGGSRIARYDTINESTEGTRTDAFRLGWITSRQGSYYIVDILAPGTPAICSFLSAGHGMEDPGTPSFSHARAAGRHDTSITLTDIGLYTFSGATMSAVSYKLEGAP